MTVGSNDDGAVGGELLVVGQDPESFEFDVEVGLGGPAWAGSFGRELIRASA
jgi:hypothetical protein